MDAKTDERDGKRHATVGDVIAPGLDEDSLEAAQDRLNRFEDVAIEDYGNVPTWLITARIVLQNARQHWDLRAEGYRDE